MLNFRYLLILFLFLSLNSYSILEIGINCRFDSDGWCIFGQDVMTTSGNDAVWETFDTGFDNTLESINASFNVVADDFPNWEVSGAAAANTVNWTSLLTSSGNVGSYNSQLSAWEGYYDAAWRNQTSSIMENYALAATRSAWENNNIYAVDARATALVNSNAAADSASSAASSALDALNSANDVQNDLNRVSEAQTQATTDINTKISEIFVNVDGVQTQALTDIEQYVQNVLNTPVNVVDHVPLMTAALGTGTGSLNALASHISNAGNSQDNTALVNSLNGLSNSVSNLGSTSQVGTLNAIGDLQGALGNNTGALGGLSDSLTNGDGNGEIGNKSAGLFNALKNSFIVPSFASSGSSCPTWAFSDGALLVGGLVIDSHCEVIDMIRPSFELAMLSFFSVMGFRVVFSA